MKSIFIIFLFLLSANIKAQNCLLYKDINCKNACEYFSEADNYSQGSKVSQMIFDSCISICAGFPEAYYEKSVPYLKRGDFIAWKALMDKAVALNPSLYLGLRAWCMFKFLRDYSNTLDDLDMLLKYMPHGQLGYSGDGDYDLYIIRALCKRELNDFNGALADFDKCIKGHESKKNIGLYDYLHRGVTRMKLNDYQGALEDFKKQVKVYEKLADTQYYLGLTYMKLGHIAAAKESFESAYALFTKTGYPRQYDYCEPLDIVYLSDIEENLEKIRK